MSEGALAWKRAVFWPGFTIGVHKGVPQIFFLFCFFIIAVVILFNPRLSEDPNSGFYSIIALYLIHGTLWWVLGYCVRVWNWLKQFSPVTARIANALIWVFAWEIRILAEGDAPSWLRYWLTILMGLSFAACALMWLSYLSVAITYQILAVLEAVTEVTGLWLGYKEWRKK